MRIACLRRSSVSRLRLRSICPPFFPAQAERLAAGLEKASAAHTYLAVSCPVPLHVSDFGEWAKIASSMAEGIKAFARVRHGRLCGAAASRCQIGTF